jgi:putative membrane protein
VFLRWLVASLHLVALALGCAGIFSRARLLRRIHDDRDLSELFVADNLWGAAAFLWLGTGASRAFWGLENGTAYYLNEPLFYAKISLFVLIVLLEIWPAVTFVKWRRDRSRALSVSHRKVRALARISDLQLAIVVVIVFIATAVARGLWV